MDEEPGQVVTAALLRFVMANHHQIHLQGWTMGQCLGCFWVECCVCGDMYCGDESHEADGGSPWPHELPSHRNYTLKCMPLPMSDVAQAYRNHPEKTEQAVHKVGNMGWGTWGWVP